MKKQSPPIKNLRKALNLASRRLLLFVADARYFTETYDPLFASRWRRNAWRRKGKITIALNRAAKSARLIGNAELIISIAEMRRLTKTVIRYCDNFSSCGFDVRPWAGTQSLARFNDEIALAKRLLRGVST